MGGKSQAPAPDPNIGLAQQQNAAIAQQQLDFARQQYAAELPLQQQYAQLAQQYTQSQIAAQQNQQLLAQDYQTRMQGTFYPIQDTLAMQSLGYYDASPEQQKALEDAYTSKNQQLINQQYANQIQQVRDAASQQRTNAQGAAQQLGLTLGADNNLSSAIAAQQQTVADMRAALGDMTPGKSDFNAQQSKLNDAQMQLDKLNAFQTSYGDYLTAGQGGTLADQKLAQQIAGLQTQQQTALGNVGSNLDTVRAYAQTYKASQDAAAGAATADVNRAYSNQQQQLQAQLAQYGIDPTSGRYQSMLNSNSVMQAADAAGAANQARNAAKQLGWAQRMDVQGLGAGLAGNQASSTQIASGLGSGAMSAQNSIIGNMNQVGSTFMSGLGAASGTYGGIGSLGMQNSQLAMQQYQSGQTGKGAMFGALAGAAGMALGGPLGGALASSLTSAATTP